VTRGIKNAEKEFSMAKEIWSRNWDRMTFEEQREYRDRKLSYFVRTQLYPYSPFYRKLFDVNKIDPNRVRGVEDLRNLPFTYKADIAPDNDEPERFRELILQPNDELIREFMPWSQMMRRRRDRLFKGEEYLKRQLWKDFGPVHIQFTTGHTGRPTPILYAANDVERMAEAGRRIMELAGFGTTIDYPNSSIVNAMPFAPHLGFWMVSKGLDRAGILALHSGGGRALGIKRIMKAVEEMGATGIIGMPSYVYHILHVAAEQHRDFSSVRLVIISGERISDGMKEKMSQFLEGMGARNFYVLGALGFTEGRKSYSECAPDGNTGYHIFPDMDYIELVDPKTGEPVAEGEDGELVYTCLEGQGTCVMRFRTGDFVKGGIVYDPCPSCGRTVPRLASDITRGSEVKGFSLMKLKGTLVDQGAFFSVLTENPNVDEWLIEVNKAGGDPYDVDVLDVFITPKEGVDEGKLRSEIEAQLELATEVKPNSIDFLPLDALVERLRAEGCTKELRLVDKRPAH
jgi:phenylacetate-coenzyme A ligase PaaK-like adenylate-forming protein